MTTLNKIVIFWLIIFLTGISNAQSVEDTTLKLDLVKVERIEAAPGVKSVILSPDGTKVYSQNLEDMSVYEFDRAKRRLRRKLKFIPHAGKGFNYEMKRSISSFQEKPVEAHITHGGRFLWISLHNAAGVAVFDLKDGSTCFRNTVCKDAYVYDYTDEMTGDDISDKCENEENCKREKVKLMLLKTGTTPKVITSSPDGKYLFVANWHSNTVSVLKIDSDNPNDWIKITDLKTGRIPRGLAVSADSRFLYIAQMGGNVISEVILADFRKVREIRTGINPRHLAIDGRFIYVSLNLSSKLEKINLSDGKLTVADTCRLPRTISLSKDKKIIFSVCYQGNSLQAFSADDLSLLGSWETSIHPVGVEVYQNDEYTEVWVGNYTSGIIEVFSFKPGTNNELSVSGRKF